MKPADPSKPANSVAGLLADQDLRRYLINRGLITPRIEGLPWTTNYERARAIQIARRQMEKAR